MIKKITLLTLLFGFTLNILADEGYEERERICPEVDKNYTKIEAGKFKSGSSLEEKQKIKPKIAGILNIFEREPDLHEKETLEFEISKKLVTQAEFRYFVRWTGHRSPSITMEEWEKQKKFFDFEISPNFTFDKVEKYIWPGARFPENLGEHPVVLVSKKDAEKYAEWLSSQDGCKYRLPTADELEKAIRGKDGRTYPWGNKWDSSYLNSGNWNGTSKVGEYEKDKSPYPYGLLDAMGNVMEWTATESETNDKNIISKTITKGCSWNSIPETCRTAFFREWDENTKHILIGFRLIREIPKKEIIEPPKS
tara:strand:+ start:8697 stop:9623 length:927 start_codon:yes stop_codon:yes gene_type:complete